jgi:hypothetical protein
VRGDDEHAARRHLVDLGHEHRTALLQVVDDVCVVHDLPAHVDRRAKAIECPVDDVDGAFDAGAERPRVGQHDRSVAHRRGPGVYRWYGDPQRPQPPRAACQRRWVVKRRRRRVHDRPYDREGLAGLGQPVRLGVDGQRATGGEFRPCGAGHDVRP